MSSARAENNLDLAARHILASITKDGDSYEFDHGSRQWCLWEPYDLAKHYQHSHDETPANIEWLIGRGFTESDNPNLSFKIPIDPDDGPEVVIEQVSQGLALSVTAGDDRRKEAFIKWNPNRGDVRRLCDGLRIFLKDDE